MEEESSWDRCAICLADLHEEADNSELKDLVCGHTFHKECVEQWLLMVPTCPVCRSRQPFCPWHHTVYHLPTPTALYSFIVPGGSELPFLPSTTTTLRLPRHAPREFELTVPSLSRSEGDPPRSTPGSDGSPSQRIPGIVPRAFPVIHLHSASARWPEVTSRGSRRRERRLRRLRTRRVRPSTIDVIRPSFGRLVRCESEGTGAPRWVRQPGRPSPVVSPEIEIVLDTFLYE